VAGAALWLAAALSPVVALAASVAAGTASLDAELADGLVVAPEQADTRTRAERPASRCAARIRLGFILLLHIDLRVAVLRSVVIASIAPRRTP